MKTAFIPAGATAALVLGLSACVPTQNAATDPAGADNAYKACKVEDYQGYVGQNRTAVPAAPQGQVFRVLCSTCAATMDYRENRVNFVYDEATDVIQQVKCG